MSHTLQHDSAADARVLNDPQMSPRLPLLVQRLAPVVWIVGLISLAVNMYQGFDHAQHSFLLDVGVFRDAGRALLDGNPLYSDDFPTRSGFRFIYPPFAALLFAPLAWLTEGLMEWLWTLGTFAAVFGVIAMATYRAGLGRGVDAPASVQEKASILTRGTWWMWALALTGCAISLEPIASHVMYGQINIFLVLLVTADVLGFMPRKVRGLGIGIAAGIKITPAAYALIFLVRKDWWSLARSAGFFLVTAVIGFAVRAQDSWYFWTVEFFNPDRGGAPPYVRNQALTGLLSRGGMNEDLAHTIMGPGFLVFAVLSIIGAWKLEKAGRPVDSLLLVVLGIVVASPLAVTHHWAGVVLMFVLLFRPLNKWVLGALVLSIVAHFFGWYTIYGDDYYEAVDLQGLVFPEYFLANAQGITGVLLFFALFFTALKTPSQAGPRGGAHSGRSISPTTSA